MNELKKMVVKKYNEIREKKSDYYPDRVVFLMAYKMIMKKNPEGEIFPEFMLCELIDFQEISNNS